MQKFLILLTIMLLLCEVALSQELIIKGRVRCMNQSAHSTKGAENIIVVPTFKPSRSAITASSPSGYFEFNTGIPLKTLQDKQVNVYVVSRCAGCKDIVKRVFVSEDQDRQNKDDSKSYVTIKQWMLANNCEEVELTPYHADSILAEIQKQPEQKLSELTNATAIAGTPALLNLLTTLTNVVGLVPPATGVFDAIEIGEGQINYGQFLFASAMTHTANSGFNFSPSRDLSESVFWNPSAMPNSIKPYNISLLTNVKNNGKLNFSAKLSDKFSLGAGAIFTMQDEFRFVKFDTPTPPPQKSSDSVQFDLKEYAVYFSPAYKINDKLSVGVSIKSIWQNFSIPVNVNIQQPNEITNDFTFQDIKEQYFDADLSLTYIVSKSFQVGINAMNLAGTELYADAFVPGEENLAPIQNQRSLGVGLNYKYQRFNFGTDILFTEDDFYDATIGINYVPFNDALISAGYAINQSSYSLAFRLKHFRIAYIDDNDFLINEKRKGKSGILNGRLYGGFSFNF
ncbi:MAG: hypothetical protein H0V30_01865 [Chitinophagaceae bacterium]|nr:hypothetical protein [Chitinophagaceae bacterium]